jgi:hypothetical protein
MQDLGIRKKTVFLAVGIGAILALTASRTIFPFRPALKSSPEQNPDPFRSLAEGDKMPRPSQRHVVRNLTPMKESAEVSPAPGPVVKTFAGFLVSPPEVRGDPVQISWPHSTKPFLRATPQSALSPPLF